ncbi:MAG TPA: RNA polymerase sigma factor [Gaiellales bacterium]|jgi:RNA polymerase sigma-70 factor (ECF subfamily)|nr:RNA polymerase sigma factor [Gaiellales bacterium]
MIKSAPDEMTELFTSCGGQLWRSLLAASAGRHDIADDITAEAFSQYLKHRETVRDPLAYMFRVAYRLLAKELAREKRQVLRSPDRAQSARTESVLSPTLTEALLGISVEQRFAVVLHYFLDYTVSEVASLTGSSVPAVKVRLHRARKQLREALPDREVHDV